MLIYTYIILHIKLPIRYIMYSSNSTRTTVVYYYVYVTTIVPVARSYYYHYIYFFPSIDGPQPKTRRVFRKNNKKKKKLRQIFYFFAKIDLATTRCAHTTYSLDCVYTPRIDTITVIKYFNDCLLSVRQSLHRTRT